MGLAREFLETARTLLSQKPVTQGNLRRVASTNYYAIFHLLVETVCGYWPESQRARLARQFDHRRMKQISQQFFDQKKDLNVVPSAEEGFVFLLCQHFVKLQQLRHDADYNIADTFSHDEVSEDFQVLSTIFESWTVFRLSTVAQGYLYSLLFVDRKDTDRKP